jgi:hypothetical protein
VAALKAWKRSWMLPTPDRASRVLLHMTHYHDQLLKDMGEEHLRKLPSRLAEAFTPYQPSDYHGIVGNGSAEGAVDQGRALCTYCKGRQCKRRCNR